MNSYIQYIILLFFGINFLNSTFAQSTVSLQDVLSQTQQSYFASNARTQKEIAQHEYKFYSSQLKPQVGFDALLPNFNKTSREIIQPSGSVAFQSISQNNASASLYVSQAIAATGGRLFLQSDLQRFDDFSTDAKLYNGLPIRIGIEQPLFGYNPFKYQNRIEPLRLEEANLAHNIEIENARLQATDLYFNVLIAEERKLIAAANEDVNEQLLEITYERFALGKVSKDEKLQLEIELKNARLNSSQATYAHQFALSQLQTYLGQSPDSSVTLTTPEALPKLTIDIQLIESIAIKNSPDVLAFQRRQIEAEDEIAKQRAAFGIKTNLFASYGYARGSEKLQDVYQNPFDEQQVRLSISIPLMDWGRRKSAVSIAKLQHKNALNQMAQEELELRNSVRQTAFEFIQLQQEIQLSQSIVETAQQRSEISNQRYILGDISITDLTIAQREKDSTRRNYIAALRRYWVTYARLRALTGYDILANKNINYN